MIRSTLLVTSIALAALPAGALAAPRHYDIPAGDLAATLTRFAGETGITLIADDRLTAGKASAGLRGDFDAEDGLRALLAGTRLRLVALSGGGFRLEAAASASTTSTTALAPVTVTTAAGFEQVVSRAPASISVITREQLQRRPVTDFTDVVRDIPGASITNGEGRNVDISLRGMPPGYTLILIDGKRQNLNGIARRGNNNVRQSFMPPASAIERIEVIRGPMSTLYGADAMGGVINVITKKGSPQWNGEVSADYLAQDDSKFGNARGMSAYFNGPLIADQLGLQLSAREQFRDEDRVPRGQPERINRNLTGRLWYTPTPDHDFTFEATREKFEMNAWVTGRSPGSLWEQRTERTSWSLAHTGRWALGSSDLVFQKEDAEKDNIKADNWTLDAKFLAPWNGWGNHLTTFGTQLTRNKVDSWNLQSVGGGVIDVIEQKNQALFIEDEWGLLPDVSATLGVRFDDPDDFSSHVSPRAYLVWSPMPQLTLKGGVATGFKAPQADYVAPGLITESSNVTTGVVSYTYANSDLKPETSTNYEIGAIWEGDSGLNLSLTLFRTEYDDKLSTNSFEVFKDDGSPSSGPMDPAGLCQPASGQYGCIWSERINVDKARTEGVELTLQTPLVDRWSLTTSYTYLESEQRSGPDKGLPLSGTPRHKLVNTLDWQATERVNLWLSHSLRSALRMSNRPAPACFGSGSCPSLAMLDLGGTVRVDDRLSFNLGLYNLTNKSWWDYDTRGSVEDGRRYYVRATYAF